MRLSRLCELKIVLAVLLPYSMLSIGSEFAHNHAARQQEARTESRLRHDILTTGAPSGASISLASPSSDARNCPACAWDRTNLSRGPAAPAGVPEQMIAGSVSPENCGSLASGQDLHSSRAPPIS